MKTILPGETLQFTFNTLDATGAPITLASGATVVKRRGTDTTFTTGMTLTLDKREAGGTALTGHHVVDIVTTDLSVYLPGYDYEVYISVGTVSSVSKVGIVVGQFRISNPESVGVVCRGTVNAGGSTTAFTLGTVTLGALTNIQAGDIVKVAGLPGRIIETINTGTGAATVETALASNPSSLAFVVFGSAPADSTIPVPSDLRKALGTALTETSAGYLAAAIKKFFDVATPTGTINNLLSAASIARIDVREALGFTITIGAGAHTGTAVLASDQASKALDGKPGVVLTGTNAGRAIRFTSDSDGSGAFGYTDWFGDAFGTALAENDTVQV